MKQTLILMALTLTLHAADAQVDSADDRSIRNIATLLEKAWNAKDGAAFASVFADQHDYIVINGFYFSSMNRQQNAFAHQGLFNGVYKTNTLIMKVDKVRFLTPVLAQMTVLAATYEGTTKPTDPTAIMTILVEKQKDGWKIISFHNHSLAESFAAKTPPVPYQVMYASWYKN